MLYLEDYLEMIEHLPSELRDRFTELREMDLSVQNRVDSLDERQKNFFASCSKRTKPGEKDEEFKQIKKEYSKVIEDASEKIQISEECYGLVDRYLRKLDQELHNFKMELEADHRGITELLEKKSLDLDLPATNSLKENRHPKKARKHQTTGNQLFSRKQANADTLSQDSFSSESQSSTGVSLAATLHQMFPLQHMGAGGSGNAIAVAASQAIAATQQLTGRRTSSLKASFEAVNSLGYPANEFSLNRDLASAAASAQLATALGLQVSENSNLGPPPSKKKKGSRPTATASSTAPGTPLLDVDSIFNPDLLSGVSPSTSDLFGMNPTETDPDWTYDPNEPRYCICNQVSYGDMVACDNDDCPYEWFHYPCVGISSSPKGKWYCPTCQANMTRRKARK